jgi:hypothetical protein
MRNFWVVGLFAIICGCKIIRPSSDGGAAAYSGYQEDLSGSLPQFPDYRTAAVDVSPSGSPTSVRAVDADLDEVQRKFAQKNKSEPYFNGYSVLVFSGIDRNQAFKTQDDLKFYFPELSPEMQYEQPRYFVKVGQFTFKIEAQKVFSQVKGQFPTARIIQDRFQRKEYMTPSSNQNAPIPD